MLPAVLQSTKHRQQTDEHNQRLLTFVNCYVRSREIMQYVLDVSHTGPWPFTTTSSDSLMFRLDRPCSRYEGDRFNACDTYCCSNHLVFRSVCHTWGPRLRGGIRLLIGHKTEGCPELIESLAFMPSSTSKGVY
ncbi:hypothetical protein C0J52_13162 [Blattella germanica]|nr:hypothetical protein C0J52_13162 [Blattella germanica]